MFFILYVDLFALNIVPTIRANLIAVHVTEDVGLVPASINKELVEVPYDTVICPWLRCILWV